MNPPVARTAMPGAATTTTATTPVNAAAGPAAQPAIAAMAAGSPLLTGRILPTLLRLSVPNVLALVMSVLVGVAETYYVGQLGTVPLSAREWLPAV